MRIASGTRDHRETFKSKEIRKLEKFVGPDSTSTEEGIDDQYTLFYFSSNVSEKIINWVLKHKYTIWHLIDIYDGGVTFTSLKDLVDQINKKGEAFEGEDWEPLEES